MPRFNRMTIVAALQIVRYGTGSDNFEMLAAQWGINGECGSGSGESIMSRMARTAYQKEPPLVYTLKARLPLDRAIIERALTFNGQVVKFLAARSSGDGEVWERLVAGLRLDGFEIVETEGEDDWLGNSTTSLKLRRMLPDDVPGLDFREAENEIVALLDLSGFMVARGHLDQAINAFSRGDWAASNSQFRTFLEAYFKEIAEGFGYSGKNNHRTRVRFLGELSQPFLLSTSNEWHKNDSQPQYVHGLMSRMNPEGSHPGLSEEEDATFRLQISLVTARLFLRRYDQRKNG